MSAIYRRSADDDIKVDVSDGDDGDGIFASQSDVDDSEDVFETEMYLRQPLIPSEAFRGLTNYFSQLPPPPYDSQGETYVMPDRNEDDISSTLESGQANPPNSYRYSTSGKIKRRIGAYPREIRKTLVAALFIIVMFIATTVSLSVTHERMPRYDPLPDVVLDFFRYQKWALTASELLLSVQCVMAILIGIFHKHRFILFRRIFLLVGLLYGYRAVTMFVTVLPAANPEYKCDPKLSDSGQVLTVAIVIRRVLKIMSGIGLSMNGNHVYCGDFIYSGHTMIFVFTYLAVFEYTSRRLFILHWIAWVNSITGVALLMMARGHYSIDVIIAYYVTTRLWYLYHGMACHPALQDATGINHFSRIWWWTMFRWFEENVKSGPLPNGFNLPLPRSLCKSLKSKSRSLISETNKLARNRPRRP